MTDSELARTQSRSSRLGGLPSSALRRLRRIGAAWVLAALAEAGAYTVLGIAIRDGGGFVVVLTMALVSVVTTVLVSRSGYLSGARLAGDLYAGIGQALAAAKLSWFSAEHRALVTSAAGRGVPSLMAVPAHQLQTLICAPLVPILLVVALALVSGVIAVALAVLLMLALAGQVFAQRRLQRADADRGRSEQTATEATLELVNHVELLRTAAGPARSLDRAVEAWARQEEAMRRTNRAAASATFISVLASAAPLAGMLALLAGTGGFADPLAGLATIVLTARACAPLDDLALAGITVNEVRAQVGDYRRVVDAPRLPSSEHREQPVGYGIELQSLGQPPSLRGVSVNIPENARVHVSGPSGSGKSTLLGLLMRFDDPEHGSISLGGVPVSALSEEDIAARVAYVPQHSVVFTGTLAENIRVVRPDASDAAVLAAAQQAQLGAVIEASSHGLDQEVGVRGQGLSGGERQRVAIARALLKGSSIVILDEATSALDEATETKIAQAFAGLTSTVIVVTHRDPAVWNLETELSLKGGGGATKAGQG